MHQIIIKTMIQIPCLLELQTYNSMDFSPHTVAFKRVIIHTYKNLEKENME